MSNENNHENASCRFAEQIVSYLYDEISAAEKSTLESHLPFCAPCADELGGFSAVRFSVREWRAEDFANLSTPVFEMPPKENTRVQALRQWLDSIAASFALSKTWATAATAGFAVLAVCAGLIWFIGNSSGRDENIAQNREHGNYQVNSALSVNNSGVDSSPVVAATLDQAANPIDKSSKQIISRDKSKLPKAATITERTIAPAELNKSQLDRMKKPASAATRGDKNNLRATPKPAAKTNIPALLPAAGDDEEDSLRLSDIFEEVSLK